ncbi:hypothetical protein EV360DRAFT_84780 [Lentinula raphanica]|nr:hypothetical protein EV360DRAFT_84780 [Lentinula raphanica]
MTRSTASHALAILILGASISTGVLAAPVHSLMTPSSMGALTGAQAQGQRPLSEGHSPEVVHANFVVPRREIEGLTRSDDLALLEKDGDDSDEELEDPKVPSLPTKTEAEEYLRENKAKLLSWFSKLEASWEELSAKLEDPPGRISSVKLISEHQNSLYRLHLALYNLRAENTRYQSLDKRVITLRNRFHAFAERELTRTEKEFYEMRRNWAEALKVPSGTAQDEACLKVYNDYKEFFEYIYAVAASAKAVISEGLFNGYKKIFDDWHERYSFNPL